MIINQPAVLTCPCCDTCPPRSCQTLILTYSLFTLSIRAHLVIFTLSFCCSVVLFWCSALSLVALRLWWYTVKFLMVYWLNDVVWYCLLIRVFGSGFTGKLWLFYLAFCWFFVTMLSRLVLLLYLLFVSVNGAIILWWNAGVEGFWFAQLIMCSSLVCNLELSGARLCAQVIHLFPAIVPCFLFELCLTILSPSVVRVSLRFGELWTRFTFRYGSPL